jgi:hypothetical protein
MEGLVRISLPYCQAFPDNSWSTRCCAKVELKFVAPRKVSLRESWNAT